MSNADALEKQAAALTAETKRAAEPTPTPTQRMMAAGYKRRPSHRALPDDTESATPRSK